ncbi:MAG: S49 family peptidase [Pseudomonadota bacterium]
MISALWRRRYPVVPLIRLSGVIGSAGRYGSGLALTPPLDRQFRRAMVTARSGVVAVAINSPGGSAVQSMLLASRLRALATRYDRRLYTFIEDIGASGGYWLACCGDRVFATPSSIVGSIGVIYAAFGFHELLERYKIERRVVTAGEDKSMLDAFSPLKDRDVARLKEIQADIHTQFVGYVKQRRGHRLKKSEKSLFEGGVWSGREALPLGLIDEVGDVYSVLGVEFGDRVVIRPMHPKRRFSFPPIRISARDTAAGTLQELSAASLWARFGL